MLNLNRWNGMVTINQQCNFKLQQKLWQKNRIKKQLKAEDFETENCILPLKLS